MEYLSVYDQSGAMLAVLDTADKIGYTLQHNDLWTAQFTLAAGDPGNAYCTAHNLVRLPDGTPSAPYGGTSLREGGRDTGLYRIVGMPSSDESGPLGGVKTYSLEHVMATLLDDVLFGYHEIGGTGVHTRDVMQYILNRQTVRRWVLGVVEFDDQFQYHFENVSLLSALLSLGEVLTEEYTWDFDTDTTPWTVNLRRADSTPGCGIHYGRNLVSIKKTMDATALVTRLYPLGYGEGVNQLTIKEANGGVPYIDADTIGTWGTKCSVWTDTRIQDAATLKARARQVLEGYKNPYITYTAKAVDLFLLTGYSWDDFLPGKLVRVMDSEHGIDFDARIVTVSKRDVNGDPGDIEITIANTPRDAADSINTLADRVGIGELYSQGATNLFAIPFADNADASHPATFRVYIPEGMVRINRMLLTWQLQRFRAYSTGAAAGGGNTHTSSTKNQESVTSASGGSCQVTSVQRVVAKSTDSASDLIGWTFGPREQNDGSVMNNTGSRELTTQNAGSHDHTVNSHDHSLSNHRHEMGHGHRVEFDGTTVTVYGYDGNTSSGGSGSTGTKSPGTNSKGSHSHDIAAHSHWMDHFHRLASFTIPPLDVNIPDHTHNVTIPAHNHTVTLPDHTHDIVYGIYEGDRAQNVSIVVDNVEVPAAAITSREIELSGYLSKDDNGKIRRGTWHEIRIVPDGLTRIEANLTAQVFVQSVGGGDY